MNEDNSVQIIKPPDTLSAKVTKGGPGAVDLAAIERAESVIANMAGDYLKWVEEDLVNISAALKDLKENRVDDEKRVDKIFQIAHDMKGQGGSFGYDLMTILGNDLCRFIEGKRNLSDVDIEVIDLYIGTMQVVISRNMSGDGGPEGNKVLTGLAAVVAKITS